MRILIDVDPLDLAEVPRPGMGLAAVFHPGEDRRHIHHLIVTGAQWLEDGRVRLTCELPAAELLTRTNA